MTITINYIGHSAFFIKSDSAGILIDPFITGNPSAVVNFNMNEVTDIILTHAHGDHLGDAINIAKKTGAQITAVFELAQYCAAQGAKSNPINFGTVKLKNALVRFLPAFHSSSTPDGQYAGMPASVLIEAEGKKIYHAGDTCLNQEMKTSGEIYKPEIALLPIGGHFTMYVDDAVIASEWVGARTVIPMHYSTFSAIEADTQDFKNKTEKNNKKCIIMKPGETLAI